MTACSHPRSVHQESPASPSTWINRLNPFDYLKGDSANFAAQSVPEQDTASDEGSTLEESDAEDVDGDVEELLWEAQVRLQIICKADFG